MEPGRYLGLCPSSDSPLFFGETELVIDAEGIRMRLATGYTITTLSEGPLAALYEMESEDVGDQFKDPADGEGVLGWRLRDTSIRLVLLPDLEIYQGFPHLLVRGLPGEVNPKQPAALFTPEQVQADAHARKLSDFEQEAGLPVGVPRLALNGHPPTLTTS